jgi:nicotinamidase/pyrazinamidase
MPPRKFIFWEVDVQADFMLPGGKLYVPGAEQIIPNIRRLVNAAIEQGIFLVASGDAHPEGDPEFQMFPPHCLRGSPGARILPEGLAKNFLTIANDASRALPAESLRSSQVVLEKQTLDVFDNPHASTLVEQLGERLGGDAEFIVFGVVTEYCVRAAAKGLLERGRKVAVVTDAIETLRREDGQRTLDELKALGARFVTTDEVLTDIRGAAPSNETRETAAQ